MLKVGIIGAGGGIAKNHFNAYDELAKKGMAEVVVCCDAHPENIEAKENVRIYSDYNELIEKEKGNLDIIDICLPTFLHKEVSIKALEAGFHVLCEKPMALNYEDAAAMVEASKRTGKKLMIAQVVRFMWDFELMREYIKNEELGKIRNVKVTEYIKGLPLGQDGWFRKRELSGGAIFDVHVHAVDSLIWFFGVPESVSTIANYNDGVKYDAISTNVVYKDGTFVNIQADWAAASAMHNPGRTLRLNFENGYIIRDGSQVVKVDRDDNVVPLTVANAQNCYNKEIEYFVNCVINDEPLDVCPPEESAMAIKFVCNEIKSADNKGEKVMFD